MAIKEKKRFPPVPKIPAATILKEYLEKGLTAAEAVAKFKADHPEYHPKDRDDQGTPLTFEAVIADYIREYGMTPGQAINAAATHNPGLQHDYFERLRVGAAMDLDWVCEGHCV